mgnify:CR=1 FL=1
MAYNLLVTYDLDKPGQNYDAVHAKIQSLGSWYHPQQSVYYLHTALSAQQAHAAILTVMDVNERLIVADVALIVISPAPQQDVDAINAIWHAAA